MKTSCSVVLVVSVFLGSAGCIVPAAAQSIKIPKSIGPAEDGAQTLQEEQVRAATRSAIAQQRQMLQTQREREETVCREKFRVNDCLEEVRLRYRAPLLELRHKELAVNDAERKARGREQRKLVEERHKKMQAAQELDQPDAGMLEPGDTDADINAADWAHMAEQRALQQNRRQANKREENARRADGRKQREAESRQRYDIKLRKAQERRAQKEEQGITGRNAATLPVPP